MTALGVLIAFYYGLTGLVCFWFYRKSLRHSTRNLFVQGILPLLGWAIMWSIGGYSLVQDWQPSSSYTTWHVPGLGWDIGGAFLLAGGLAPARDRPDVHLPASSIPPFFKGEVLNAGTATLVPEDIGTPIGLFGIEPEEGKAGISD